MLKILSLFCTLTLVSGQTTPTPSYIASGCSTHCRMKDKDLTCWKNSLAFYENIVLGEMQNFVAVQSSIASWRKTNGKPINSTATELESIAALSGFYDDIENNWNDDEDNQRDVLSDDVIATVVGALIEDVNFKDIEIRHSLCPIPCEEDYVIWQYLFFASIGVSALLALAVIPFVFRSARHDHENSSSADPLIKT